MIDEAQHGAREVNRGIAYALHLFLGLLAASIPLLGLLQDAGIVTHDFAQGWGMMIVLGLGLPAVVLMPVALVFSVLPRPRDPALLSLGALLLLLAAAMFFEMAEPAAFFVVGAYVLAALGFCIRWVLSLWKLRQGEGDRAARPLRRRAWLDRAYGLHLFITVMLLLSWSPLGGEWLMRFSLVLRAWRSAMTYFLVPAAVLLPFAAGLRHWPPLLLSLLLAVGYLLPFFLTNPISYPVLLAYFVASLAFAARWFSSARKSSP